MTTSQTSTRPGGTAPDDPAPPTTRGRLTRLPGFGVPTARFVQRWAIALLVANVGIVATGGAVRLTGSGLGCPTWPKCAAGSFVPHQELGYHAAIEFSNRMLTWVLIAVAIAAWTAVWRRTESSTTDRWLVTVIALGIPFQGVIGGITVLTDLNPWIVALHFVLSMVLVSASTVLVYRTRRRPSSRPAARQPVYRLGRHLAWLTYAVTWVTIYLGTVVTGSGPHAGDVNAPRNGLSPDHATQLHADAVFVLIGLSVALFIFTRVLGLAQQRAALVFVGLLALQGVIGVVQYLTDLPIPLVIAHMIGSAALLIGATWIILEFRSAESSDDASQATAPVRASRT